MNWPQTVTLKDAAVSRTAYKRTCMKKKTNKKCSGNLQLVLVQNQTGSFDKESEGLFTHLLKLLVDNPECGRCEQAI
jgi:hypothetical protein